MAIDKIAKAIVAGAASLSATVGTAALDGQITGVEVVVIITATLSAAAFVWAVPNAQDKPKEDGA